MSDKKQVTLDPTQSCLFIVAIFIIAFASSGITYIFAGWRTALALLLAEFIAFAIWLLVGILKGAFKSAS